MTERLSNLFLQPAATAMDQARRIAAESSRYNVGVLRRTINVPVMPLVFLEPDVQPRFRYSRVANNERPEIPARQAGHFVVSTEVWVDPVRGARASHHHSGSGQSPRRAERGTLLD